ncbi:myotubularin-related protein 4-like, partial [Plectropomus leopardus]|uniref:myotubularin-related protein 4-like n=1 Tax=Plectropomus leopardus TaxID=160734 RepID=UPI001C4C0717
CHFATFKQCQEWVKRLNRAIAHPARLEDLFALAYHAWCLGGSADDEDQHVHLCRPGDHVRQRMEMEVKRMGFDTQNVWRVSDINCNFKYVTDKQGSYTVLPAHLQDISRTF